MDQYKETSQLAAELATLDTAKIEIVDYITSDGFDALAEEDRLVLHLQHSAMCSLSHALEIRLGRRR